MLEPQLKYAILQGDLPLVVSKTQVTSLTLSEKILALGTQAGSIHVMDYAGNQVLCLTHHKGAVHELSFDAGGEILASCSEDGTVVIASLYSDTAIVRYDFRTPVKGLALDPRYAARRTKEVVLVTQQGSVQLSGQGWLGRSDTVLNPGPGVQVVRWWNNLIAWASGTKLMVYCTTQHLLIRTIVRTPHGPAAAYSHASLLFGQNGYLYASWPDCVKVARTFTVENNIGGLGTQVELVAEWKPSQLVLGVSPFGKDLAVLAFKPAQVQDAPPPELAPAKTAGQSAGNAPAPAPAEATIVAPSLLQLCIVTLQGAELAVDDLPLEAALPLLLPPGPCPYRLVPSLPATTIAATAQRLQTQQLSHAPDVLARVRDSAVTGLTHVEPPGSPASSISQAVDLSRGHATHGPGSERGTSGVQTPAARLCQPPLYEEGAEFQYFVVHPKAVLVGHMRDESDRAEWLYEQGSWDAALLLVEARPRDIKPDMQEKILQGFIADLLTRQAWEEAAALSARLLRGSREQWERWVYMFAQSRQLPKLALYIPTEAPRLAGHVYDMVLQSLLVNLADHATALALAKRWPVGLYSGPVLVEAVVGRMKRGGPEAETCELWLLLAYLYETQGRPDLTLSIFLQLRDPTAFDFIAARHEGLLAGMTGKRVAQLVDLDLEKALRLLVRHVDVLPPSLVVPGLQEALSEAEGTDAREPWRHALWRYLAAVHDAEPGAAAQYQELQVSLTADYAPSKLLELLSSASAMPLEMALAICEERGLVAEQVFILGRMGNALRALHLIIDKLGDIPQAIEFVHGQQDEELWEHLISWALSSPDTTGSLLDHIGGHLNPLALVRRIPAGLTIPHLRDRIRVIIADFRTQTSLREGCNVILRSDCAHAVARLHRSARAAVAISYVLPTPSTAPVMPPSALGSSAATLAWSRCSTSQSGLEPLPPGEIPHPRLAVVAAALSLAPGQPQGLGLTQQHMQGPTGAASGKPGGGVGGGQGQGSQGGPQGMWLGCLAPIFSTEDATEIPYDSASFASPVKPGRQSMHSRRATRPPGIASATLAGHEHLRSLAAAWGAPIC